MAILKLCNRYDPVLRKKAKKIKEIDSDTQALIDNMIETMKAALGVGLAAPQIGKSIRVAVIQMPEQDVIVLINPEVVKRGGERKIVEACLSIPGYCGEITRSVWVKVKALNREGKEFRIRGEDLLGQALEHEIDHLNGVLYVDHLPSPDMLEKVVPAHESQVDTAPPQQEI
jgi:peptide deformylase